MVRGRANQHATEHGSPGRTEAASCISQCAHQLVQSSIRWLALVAAPVCCLLLRFVSSLRTCCAGCANACDSPEHGVQNVRARGIRNGRAGASHQLSGRCAAGEASQFVAPPVARTNPQAPAVLVLHAASRGHGIGGVAAPATQLSERPAGARYLLSSCSDAGTLIVNHNLPPVSPYH